MSRVGKALAASAVAAVALLGAAGTAAADTVDVCKDGCTYDTITKGIDNAKNGGTVEVGPGTYDESVSINKPGLVLKSTDGAAATIIRGPHDDGQSATVRIGASDVTVDGFTITRSGNDPENWAGNDKVIGLAIQGQGNTNALVQNNVITANRNGVDINDSSDHELRGNAITNNRTGIILRNRTDDLAVENNTITGNWTLGVLFLDMGGAPPQQALNSHFYDNNISGNWYAQVVDRQVAAPGTNVKDFGGNWLGTNDPKATAEPTTEPEYNDLIPVEFGGDSTPPPTALTIAGEAAENVDFSPFLWTDADSDPGPGFAGDFSEVGVPVGGDINADGVDVVGSGGTVHLQAGEYKPAAMIALDDDITLAGAQAGVDARDRSIGAEESIIDGGDMAASGRNYAIVQLSAPGATVDGVTIRNFTRPGVQMWNQSSGYTLRNSIVTDTALGLDLETADAGAQPTTIERNRFEGNNRASAQSGIYGDGPATDVTIRDNRFTGHTNVPINIAGVGAGRVQRDLTISGNTFENERHLLLLDAENVRVTGNTFTDGRSQAISVQGGLHDLTIAGNTIANLTGSGIRFADFYGAGPSTSTTITGNTITNTNGEGRAGEGAIAVTRLNTKLEPVGDPGYDGTLTVSGNRIVGNDGGIHNDVAGASVDATGNWWGCNAGPGSAGCDTVTGSGVDASSPLQLTGSADPGFIGLGQNATITASLGAPDGTPVSFAVEQGGLSSTTGTLASGSAGVTYLATAYGLAGATVTVDNQTVPVSLVVPFPPPAPGPTPDAEPTPTPPPPAPPVTGEEQSVSPPAPSPATREQVRQARREARDTLSAPAKVDRAFDFGGQALVLVPTVGRKRDANTPVVRGSNVRFDRGSLRSGAPQSLMALSCPTVDCTATVTITFTYRDARGRVRTVTVPASQQDIAAGGVAAVTLNLPRAVRQQVLRGRNVRMTVGIELEADGRSLGSQQRTLTLKTTQQPKRTRSGR